MEPKQIKRLFNDCKTKIHLIDNFFKIVTEGVNGSKSLETLQNELQNFYDNFCVNPPIKKEELKQAYEEIINYKTELLEGTEHKEAIKTDIEYSQKEITNFYNKCFIEEGENIQGKIDNLYKQIENFYKEWLDKNDKNKSALLNQWYKEFDNKYKYLFQGGQNSKVNTVKRNIEKINKFAPKLESLYKEKDQKIKEVEKDIETKQNEVTALLGGATVKTLVQGYIEAKSEYAKKEYPKEKGFLSYKSLTRDPYSIFYYTLFIVPIISVVLLSVLLEKNTFSFEIILYKISISLPLLWVSWFAQNSIKERKRLFEEYNHKLRVVQMYQIFTSKQQSYNLKNQEEMEKVLLKTIDYNPINKSHLKDKTFIEKIVSKVLKNNIEKIVDKTLKDKTQK